MRELLSIIVPTYEEAPNVEPLVQRLSWALEGQPAEVIFVDDSPRGDTSQAVESVQKRFGSDSFDIRLYRRLGSKAHNGLSGSVVDGIGRARGQYVAVIDGDLQHPPELIPDLLDVLKYHNRDLVIASRYINGGNSGGLSGAGRLIVSKACTWAARIVFPRRLSKITDPMTGFFMFRRGSVNPAVLQASGFKILLEILAKHPGLRTSEVPLRFAIREHGDD